jgi:hypothetical protein
MLRLPTPTVANGVVDIQRGAPRASSRQLVLNNEHDHSESPNYLDVDQTTGQEEMVLQPGIYSSIQVTGGRVRFVPGIYVLASRPGSEYSLEITGGDVLAQGVMFYNTGHDYDPITGQPDANVGPGQTTTLGRVRLDATIDFSPLDTRLHPYPDVPAAISAFNGMLVFQRRDNNAAIQAHGFGVDAGLAGTIYAPSASVWLPSRGTYDSQFIVGSMRIPGHGSVVIDFDDGQVAKAAQVFLVE